MERTSFWVAPPRDKLPRSVPAGTSGEPPTFWRKLAWTVEISIPPMRVPFSPHSSMRRPAEQIACVFGSISFLNMHPAFFPFGWEARRFFKISCILSCCFLVSSFSLNVNVALRRRRFAESFRRLWRYEKFRFSFLYSSIRFFFTSKMVAEVRRSFVSIPFAPAFPLTAPPTVPGSPIHPSNPERP